ncbi:MAG: putative aminohydrolase SsnA [Tissierellia bacterium]|nr:putative aminohydrolase SsnA [Tissierellia bacterium]
MIIGNGPLITHDEKERFFEKGAVRIVDHLVQNVGDYDQLKKEFPEEEVYDVEGRLILPGLINCHTHIYSAFARGMAVSKPARNFPEILENVWWSLDKKLTVEDAKKNAYQTLIESVRNGVTTVFDHHAAPNFIEGSLFAIGEAAREVGIRADLCYEVSDRDGEEVTKRGIKENVDFIKAYLNDEEGMLRGHFGIHASFTISDRTMEWIKEAMEGVDAGYHIHTAEGIEDQYDSLEKYGKRVVERLQDWDLLGEKTLCVHCCNVNNKEMQILRDTNTAVVHNPESNMNNAVGVTPVISMLKMGILLGIGTDAYTNDMFESLKVAKVLQSHHLADPTVGFEESLTLLFKNNPTIVERFFPHPIGVLKEGAFADLVVVDYKPYTPFNQQTYGGHLLFGVSGRMVKDTMVHGKFIMKDRRILTVDEDKIFAESRKRAPEIWKGM